MGSVVGHVQGKIRAKSQDSVHTVRENKRYNFDRRKNPTHNVKKKTNTVDILTMFEEKGEPKQRVEPSSSVHSVYHPTIR